MKVLWFTNTPSNYNRRDKHAYNGGGWIESLEDLITKKEEIEIGISFFSNSDEVKKTIRRTSYFPIYLEPAKNNIVSFIKERWLGHQSDDNKIKDILKVVGEFKPDVIHVFGTERVFARIQEYTNIPLVIHIQGIINPYTNAFFPPFFSKNDFIYGFQNLLKFFLGRNPLQQFKSFQKRVSREEQILSKVKYVMGRTHWDNMICRLYNPSIKYFHVNEALRESFYNVSYTVRNVTKIKIISTLSPNFYKGLDLVLKAAKVLSEFKTIEFEWVIVGLNVEDSFVKYFSNKLNISVYKHNLNFVGRKDPKELVDLLTNSDIYIHPSYIDNSPNSVCEAQLIGLPVIACDVGGVSTLINHMNDGILIPSNGVFELVYWIKHLSENQELRKSLSSKAKLVADARHDLEIIYDSLINTYSQIIKENERC